MSEEYRSSQNVGSVRCPSNEFVSCVSSCAPGNDEVLPMDAEDSLPMFPASNVRANSSEATASSPLIMKLKSFENRELQPNENDVDVDFFSQLLIFYMIKEDWTKARQCRLRAEASVTNAKMNTLLLICRHLEECNTGAALHLIKNASFDCPIKDLIMELEKGIMLSILRMVEHVYLNIEAVKLAEMFDAESNDELQKILDEVGWVQEDGYVIPKMTSELKTKLSELDPLHQGRVSPTFSSVNKKKVKEPVDINKLVEYATFLEVDT